jgi:hypothetical protein
MLSYKKWLKNILDLNNQIKIHYIIYNHFLTNPLAIGNSSLGVGYFSTLDYFLALPALCWEDLLPYLIK